MANPIKFTKAYFIRPLFTATIAIATALTLSCSSGDDNNNDGGGGGGSFTESSQLYRKDGSLYTGSGVIKIKQTYNAGKVENGKVSLNDPLPAVSSDKLKAFMDDEYIESRNCTNYPSDIQVLYDPDDLFALYGNDDKPIGPLQIMDEQKKQFLLYIYFSQAGKITCSKGKKINIDAKAGWNKIYVVDTKNTGVDYNEEWSTTNILTKEVRWVLTKENQ